METDRCEEADCDTGWFSGWEEADDQFDSLFNFKWKPVSNGINFDLIGKHGLKQLVNHIKGHSELTTKDRLFTNLRDHFSQIKRKDLNSMVPITFVIDYHMDSVTSRLNSFVAIHKIIDKVIQKGYSLEKDVEIINDKIQKY